MNFEKAKVFIDYEEYEYLKGLLNQADPYEWKLIGPISEIESLKEYLVSNGTHYCVGVFSNGSWDLDRYNLKPTHYAEINPCPKITFPTEPNADNDDLPF